MQLRVFLSTGRRFYSGANSSARSCGNARSTGTVLDCRTSFIIQIIRVRVSAAVVAHDWVGGVHHRRDDSQRHQQTDRARIEGDHHESDGLAEEVRLQNCPKDHVFGDHNAVAENLVAAGSATAGVGGVILSDLHEFK